MFEDAQVAERELVDDYLRGDLSATDREAFEDVYLQSEARRERLAIADSLWRVASRDQPGQYEVVETSRSAFRILNAWKIAFAGLAIAALLIVFGYFVPTLRNGNEMVQQPDETTPVIGTVENQNAPAVPERASVNQNPESIVIETNVNTIATKERKSESSRPSKSASTLATFTLLPGALRDEGEQSIKVPSTARSVSIRLSASKEAPSYRAYSVAIRSADGEMVYSAANLTSLQFTVPAAKLANRTYIVFLEGQNTSGQSEPVAEYTFRVRR